MNHKNFLSICLIIISSILSLSQALTLSEISNYLLEESLVNKTPNDLVGTEALIGTLQKTTENSEEIALSIQKSPNSMDVTFMNLDDKWQFNDASFSYYSSKVELCQRQMAAFNKHLTKKLGKPVRVQVRESIFWQLPERDWGIWLTIDDTINPFTNQTGCTSKIVIIYSSQDGQNEEEDF